jgi:hypothetical protein
MAHSIRAAAKSNHDELYTPPVLVQPIIYHVREWSTNFLYKHKRKPIVLCPFDTNKSEFVLSLQEEKKYLEVKYGHINTGQDFFTYDYGAYDIVVSNPPFSRKLDVFKKLKDKPYALIANLMCLNYQEIINFFANKKLQLLMFDKRVSFDGNPSSFGSGYFCNKFLKKDLICENLLHNNVGVNFKGSRMYL